MSLNKLVRRLCEVSILAVLLCSCASDNTPKPQPMPKITNEVTLKKGWTQSSPRQVIAGSFAPTSFGGAIFVADQDGGIYKLDPSDGSVIKEYSVFGEGPLSSGVGVSGSNMFVTTQKGMLLAIDKSTGQIVWKAQLPTVSLEAPQAARDIVVVRTNDAEVLAYNANDGKPLWVYQKPIPPLTLRAVNTFNVISGEVVAVGLPGGKLALLNIFSGTPIWENYVAVPTGSTDLDKMTDIAMRPEINDKTICVATYNGKIACIDALSSNILWQKSFSSSQGVTIDEQNVYAVSQDGAVYAFDKSSGTQIWFNDTMKYRKLSAPALLGNGVISIDEDGNVHLFNRNDGHEMARVSSSLSGGVSDPLIGDNGVFFQSSNGNVVQIKNY